MKRSEMVKIIQDYLDLCYGGANNRGRQQTASNLLAILEAEGMYPPDSVIQIATQEFQGSDKPYMVGAKIIPKWEPEDAGRGLNQSIPKVRCHGSMSGKPSACGCGDCE